MFLFRHPNQNYYLVFQDIQTGKRKKLSLKTANPKDAKKLLSKYSTLPHLIYSELERKPKIPKNSKCNNVTPTPKLNSLYNHISNYLKYSELNHTLKTQKVIRQTFKFFCAYLSDTDFITLNKKSIIDCLQWVKNIDLKDIDKITMDKYLQLRLKKNSVYQSRKDKINLSGFFSYLVNNEIIEFNPVSKIKLQKIPQKLPLYLSEKDFEMIVSLTTNEVLRDIFTVAFYTGMRQMEILTLRFDMLDFENKMIKLDNHHTITKSKKFRVIPMNSKVFEVFKRLKINATTDNVFTDILPSKNMPDYISKNFKMVLRKTNLNPMIHFHNLRDSFATHLAQKGVPITVIQKLMGHSEIKTTMIYTHTNDTQLKDAINVL